MPFVKHTAHMLLLSRLSGELQAVKNADRSASQGPLQQPACGRRSLGCAPPPAMPLGNFLFPLRQLAVACHRLRSRASVHQYGAFEAIHRLLLVDLV
jgi:hypothetical protein